MDELGVRVLLMLDVLVPFLLFMASVYLSLHIAFAALITRRESSVLWFFSVVTGPLTRPVRALLPPDVGEPRVRAVSLLVYVLLWITTRVLFLQLGLRG